MTTHTSEARARISESLKRHFAENREAALQHGINMRSAYPLARTCKHCSSGFQARSGGHKWCDDCKEIRNLERRLMRSYGITLQQYNEMRDQQGGVCKICREPGKRLAVDHCHKHGTVRGLLCERCNLVLGKMQDNIQYFEEAIRYLDRSDGATATVRTAQEG